MELESLLNQRKKFKRLVFVHGDFNILHPGHIRFLKYAAEQGDCLVVGINDSLHSNSASIPNAERIEALECISFVTSIIIISDDVLDVIETLKPNVLVKGAEWKKRNNEEQVLIESLGSKLVFGSGEPTSVSYSVDLSDSVAVRQEAKMKVNAYLKRQKIEAESLFNHIKNFSNIRVAVLGDLIIDEYVSCEAVGMSREDPTIVVRPLKIDQFIGGAGIVAAHAAALGAKVDFYTVLGNDSLSVITQEKLENYNVNVNAFVDESRPTTSKRRYRAHSKTMLRVNDYRQHDLDAVIERQVISAFKSNAQQYDVVVFSDFNYGFLTQSLVTKLIKHTDENACMVADSQSSSQVGDLAKFKGMTLVTPTEYETRVTLQDNKQGLIEVSALLGDKLKCKHMFVTLGEDGLLVRSKIKNSWKTDDLPAMSSNPVDVSGAGDAMMISSALSLCVGASIWDAALIGSAASSCQIEKQGNQPLEVDELLQRLKEVLI